MRARLCTSSPRARPPGTSREGRGGQTPRQRLGGVQSARGRQSLRLVCTCRRRAAPKRPIARAIAPRFGPSTPSATRAVTPRRRSLSASRRLLVRCRLDCGAVAPSAAAAAASAAGAASAERRVTVINSTDFLSNRRSRAGECVPASERALSRSKCARESLNRQRSPRAVNVVAHASCCRVQSCSLANPYVILVQGPMKTQGLRLHPVGGSVSEGCE